MSRLSLMLARFALSAWVGGAAMFVVIGIREVTWPGFDSTTRDQLALLRFPPYYLFGFVLVGSAALATALATFGHSIGRRRGILVLLLLSAALALMTYDYLSVYSPLAEMVSPPGQARPAEFTVLHSRSRLVNAIDVGLCVLAALLLCWPRPSPRQAE
jgi:hypothetical protein